MIIDGIEHEPSSYNVCCDCGLVHRNEYIVRNVNDLHNISIAIKSWREEDMTLLFRKIRGIKVSSEKPREAIPKHYGASKLKSWKNILGYSEWVK